MKLRIRYETNEDDRGYIAKLEAHGHEVILGFLKPVRGELSSGETCWVFDPVTLDDGFIFAGKQRRRWLRQQCDRFRTDDKLSDLKEAVERMVLHSVALEFGSRVDAMEEAR